MLTAPAPVNSISNLKSHEFLVSAGKYQSGYYNRIALYSLLAHPTIFNHALLVFVRPLIHKI